MELEQLLTAIAQLRGLVAEQGIVSGSIPHTLNQLQAVIEARMQGVEANLEQRITARITDNNTGVVTTLQRVIDVQTNTAQSLEEKTTTRMRDLFDEMQLFNDVLRNAGLGTETTTRSANIELSAENRAVLERQLTGLFQRMIGEGISEMAIREGFERLRFEDAGGRVFEAAIEELLGPDGAVARIALREASNSPDFGPAMQVLFGPSGAVADAATAAAQGTELDPAFENLETKIEEGVSEALDEAGQAAADQAGQSLGASIAGGATALGNVFTAIPQMHQSITALGAAWDAPLNSTEDYMNLFSALGGTITQGVQTFEALAGVTKIASAAQAIFNAVMAMNPIVLIVIAVIALIAAIVLLIVYWDEVCAAVRDNPWIAAIGLIFGPIGILIALIVLIAAHWEEVKLAVLQAANFISIQAQRIAAFFVGIYTVAGQVWDIIVATAINAGIGIANAFISVGTEIQNFFIGVINGILEMYNAVAESAIGEFVGLEPAELIPEVDVETRLIPPREVPELDVDAAFNTGSITGGLEDMIAEQETAVAAARAADEERRAADAAAAAAPPAGAPGAPAGAPALPGLPGGAPALPAGLPAAPPAGLPRPAVPEGAAAAGGGAGPVDASVTVNGGITVNISAERLEADAAELLSDDIIAQLQARLGSLRSEQDFRTGVR